jgi:hypothetical protein
MDIMEAFLGFSTIVSGIGFALMVAAPFVNHGALFLKIFGN